MTIALMVKQTRYIMSPRTIMSATPMHFKANECNFCNLDTVFLRPSRRTNKLPITSDQTPSIQSLVKKFQVHLGFVSEKNLVEDLDTQLKMNLNESETSVSSNQGVILQVHANAITATA